MKKQANCMIDGLKYPNSDNIKNRTSTIRRAMASTLAPRKPCNSKDEDKWKRVFPRDANGELKCAYCGRTATHLDHLFPLIENGLPTGYGTEPGNLVPCCGSCNQKKRNKNWKDFMNSKFCDHVDNNIESRIDTIIKLLERFRPVQIKWDANKEFLDDWKKAYDNCVDALNKAQDIMKNYNKQLFPCNPSDYTDDNAEL